MQSIASHNDRVTPHFVSSWRNLNIFHKQIAWDGYNPAQLRNFVFLEDSLKPLFKATIQNPLTYFGSNFYSDELLKQNPILIKVDSSMVFLTKEDLSILETQAHKPGDNISFSSFLPNKVRINTKSSGPRFLVFLQSKYYGWKAEIDGIEIPILKANVAFMGVQVPKGEHVVTFSYKPRLIILGFYFSLLSVAISILLLSFPKLLKFNNRKK
jgi:hypothetical protein